MALTVQNIIDAVRSRAGINSDYISDGDVLPIINQVYFEMWNTLIDVNEDYFGIAPSAIAMAANTATYALPDFTKIKTLECGYDGTNYYLAEEIDRGIVGDLNASTAVGSTTNPKFDIWGNSATIYPTPTAADVTNAGKIRLYYFPAPIALTSVTQTTLIPTQFQYTIVDGVEAEAWVRMGDEKKEDRARRKFELDMKKMRDHASSRDWSAISGFISNSETYWNE